LAQITLNEEVFIVGEIVSGEAVIIIG
jgi:hypothetical protein